MERINYGRRNTRQPSMWRLQVRKRMWLAIIASTAFVPGLLDRAVAQTGFAPAPVAPAPVIKPNTIVEVTGPASGYRTEHVRLCYGRVELPYKQSSTGASNDSGGSQVREKPTAVKLQILDGRTGAEKAKKEFTLLSAAAELPSDPCLEYVIPAGSVVSTGTELPSVLPYETLIGVVTVSSEPVPPSPIVSSLELFTPGFNGIPVNLRYVPPFGTHFPEVTDPPPPF